MNTFTAYRIHEVAGQIQARFEALELAQLSAGEVVVRVTHSSINYKDALAATGAGRILRRYPLVGGIDLAGVVESSSDATVQAGTAVLVTGCGLSETRDGGYAQYARVPADAVVTLPVGLSAAEAMGLGTAGFTAALAVMRMEANGLAPDQGPVLVTGATGGVGSLAIDLLAGRGYQVTALTAKAAASDYLRELGATNILVSEPKQSSDPDRSSAAGSGNEAAPPVRALASARWAGVVDNLGGDVLAGLLAEVKPLGSVASIGMAVGAEVHTTVMPFILRGVNLLGIGSGAVPRATRLQVWARLGTDLRPRHLARVVTRTIDLAELPGAFAGFLAGSVRGRTVVRVP